jgi:C1A family cysteine protease
MLAKYGVCAESIWPYLIARFKQKPDSKAYNDAKSRIIKTYQTMDTLFQMKSCLADGHPFSFGFTVYESFMSDKVAKTGIAPMPEPGESPVGGHAVYAIGYDDAKQFVKVRNSWGASWGDKGNFYLPYNYIGNKNLADDMWQVTK